MLHADTTIEMNAWIFDLDAMGPFATRIDVLAHLEGCPDLSHPVAIEAAQWQDFVMPGA